MTGDTSNTFLTPSQAVLADRLIAELRGHPPHDAYMAMVSIMAATMNYRYPPRDAVATAKAIADLLVETVVRGQRGELKTNQDDGPAAIDPRFLS